MEIVPIGFAAATRFSKRSPCLTSSFALLLYWSSSETEVGDAERTLPAQLSEPRSPLVSPSLPDTLSFFRTFPPLPVSIETGVPLGYLRSVVWSFPNASPAPFSFPRPDVQIPVKSFSDKELAERVACSRAPPLEERRFPWTIGDVRLYSSVCFEYRLLKLRSYLFNFLYHLSCKKGPGRMLPIHALRSHTSHQQCDKRNSGPFSLQELLPPLPTASLRPGTG